MMPLPTENDIRERTQCVLDDHAGLEGPLLPILHGVQEEFGYVPAERCGSSPTG